jgi:hypothetical protein
MKNTKDIDYHERHKLQTYKLVVEWKEQALSNEISHKGTKIKRTTILFFLLGNSY